MNHCLKRLRSVAAFVAAWVLLALGLPFVAEAHSGGGHVHGFWNGAAHPVSGIDHLVAMVAIGLWAVQRGGRARWLMPTTFVLGMVLGGVAAPYFAGLPLVEPLIGASIVVFGLALATAAELPLSACVALIAAAAFFHGYAHAAEMQPGASAIGYGLGFVASTIALHLVGMGIGGLANRFGSKNALRISGSAIALCGLWLCVA